MDLNTASWALLRYVAGITERTAQKIVEYPQPERALPLARGTDGRPRHRPQDLRAGGRLPAHPRRREPARHDRRASRVLPRGGAASPQSLGVSVDELIAKPDLVDKVKLEGFQTETVGIYTLNDILEELRKPGRDPRDKFVAPQFREDVEEIADLHPGMTLEGVVTNVTNFGAFVDIGVHQDGLVHISELSNRYIKDPREAVKVGQIVKVQVLSADPKTKRIALSIKALQERTPPPPRPAPQPKQQSMDDKLAALSAKFNKR